MTHLDHTPRPVGATWPDEVHTDVTAALRHLPVGTVAVVVGNSFGHTSPASLPGRVVVVNKVKHWSPAARVVVLRATTDDGGSALFRPCDLRVA
ncbi:hypothetical protein [Georgenia thermotolerans]|uniref:Uncharacterized protein n=1 Tax=Georgenia thermotolerans TaxID=527326 RepID=A0A7J5USA5_9MICO|nr:hypothetical protein [Georgenia thermotolerans]KAE8765286.1 hypothetical protein GB883_04380 [Georgenia thermotolerans]